MCPEAVWGGRILNLFVSARSAVAGAGSAAAPVQFETSPSQLAAVSGRRGAPRFAAAARSRRQPPRPARPRLPSRPRVVCSLTRVTLLSVMEIEITAVCSNPITLDSCLSITAFSARCVCL